MLNTALRSVYGYPPSSASTDSSTKKPLKTKLSNEELRFYFSIAKYASSVDGKISIEESRLLNCELEKYKEKMDEETYNAIINIMEIEVDVDTLQKMYNAIKIKHVNEYKKIIDDMCRSDFMLEKEEVVFKYKMEMIFLGMKPSDIFKIVGNKSNSNEFKNTKVIKYLTEKEVKKFYPETNISFDNYFGSSAESVGILRLRQVSKCMI